jgi:hypothetical protein
MPCYRCAGAGPHGAAGYRGGGEGQGGEVTLQLFLCGLALAIGGVAGGLSKFAARLGWVWSFAIGVAAAITVLVIGYAGATATDFVSVPATHRSN